MRRVLTLGFTRQPWLLVYQMGKVGSQTVEATLRNAGLPHQICRLHLLSPRHRSEFKAWLGNPEVPEATKESLRRQLTEARILYRGIRVRRHWAALGRCVRKLEIVAGVREPVDLLLASIFQNSANYFASLGAITVEACRNLLLHPAQMGESRFHQFEETCRFIHDWFDIELKGVLGVDVYARPFAHSDGCMIYENALARVLVYRYEDFGRIQGMLEKFLDAPLGGMVNRNIGVEKEYGRAYLEVKRKLRLPDDFLTQQYSSRLARHFYNQEERDRLSVRWRG